MDVLGLLMGDGNSTMVGLLVFLAAGTLAFSVMAVVRVQGSVKRRAADHRPDRRRWIGRAARARCGIRA